jgi:hypothetical protein
MISFRKYGKKSQNFQVLNNCELPLQNRGVLKSVIIASNVKRQPENFKQDDAYRGLRRLCESLRLSKNIRKRLIIFGFSTIMDFKTPLMLYGAYTCPRHPLGETRMRLASDGSMLTTDGSPPSLFQAACAFFNVCVISANDTVAEPAIA